MPVSAMRILRGPPVEVGPCEVVQRVLAAGDGASHHLSIQVVRKLTGTTQQQWQWQQQWQVQFGN